MTVIRPNSISGVTSITALANEINVFRHNGVLAGLQLNGVNHHTSAGVSTFHTVNVLGNLDVAGVLTYQDVTNVDSLGIGTFRSGINVSGGQLDVGSNIKIGNAGVITATSFVGDGSNLTGLSATSDKIEEGNSKVEVVDTGTGYVSVVTDNYERARFSGSGLAQGKLFVGDTTGVNNSYGSNAGHVVIVRNSGAEPATLRLFGYGPGASDGTINNRIDFASHQSGSGGQTFAKIESVIRGSSDNSSDLTFHTASSATVSEKVRITKDGHLNAGGTVLSISDLNWSPDTYQRPHIFSGITGGNPSDGNIVLASPETNPSNTRIGAVVFGCKTSSNSGVSNSGVKASIEGYTNTNVSDAWKTGSYIKFLTRSDNGNLSEKLRITSDGNITFGHTSSSLAITSAPIRYISGGRDYWNGTKGDYRALRFRVYDNDGNIDDQYGIGISSSELEIQSEQDIGIYAGTSGSNTGRRSLRILLDNSENTLKFLSNTKTAFLGSVANPQQHAFVNIGSNSGTSETRAIDVWGSWGTGENKSITFNHGSTVNQMVAQINAIHYGGTPSRTTPHSSLRWGKLYHTTDSTTYTMTLDSTGTTSADLNLKGAYRSSNHPAFCVSGSSMSNFSSTTKIQYTTHGTHGVNQDGFDNANDRFVAPVDGVYHFYARHWYQSGVNNSTVWLYFYRNGAQIKENRTSFGSSGPPEYVTVQLSTTIYLSATNYIEVYAASTNNAFHPSSGSFHTEFSGFLVC